MNKFQYSLDLSFWLFLVVKVIRQFGYFQRVVKVISSPRLGCFSQLKKMIFNAKHSDQ